MKTSERLMKATESIWKAYGRHPFVLGIQNGSLDREKFRRYIIQDCLYLKDFAKVFGIGVAKAKSLETANMFAGYIPAMNGELDIHSGYLARMGITQDELDAAVPSIDNLSYTSYMLRTAYEESEAEILAAILPCAYSYEIIAKNMLRNNSDSVNDSFYGDWIKGYISDAYAADNRRLLDTLDRLTGSYTEAQLRHITDIFVICSRYELAFWDMSWNMSI